MQSVSSDNGSMGSQINHMLRKITQVFVMNGGCYFVKCFFFFCIYDPVGFIVSLVDVMYHTD